MINPEWRSRDTTGMVVLDKQRGTWHEFNRPGQCGMLSVLMSLLWWYERLDEPSLSWISALNDVAWVIGELVESNK